MPELPEVETVVRTLQNMIQGRRIEDIEVKWDKTVDQDTDIFKQKLINQHFNEFKRRGKYLLFEMDDCTLCVHLRMEGKFFVQNKDEEISKHVHVIFSLDDGTQLRFHDTRKFGRMEVVEKRENYDDLKGLGLEPFDCRLNVLYLNEMRKGRSISLKQFLLDQHVIAGIGNIYADEICYLMRLHPATRISKLSRKDLQNCIDSTQKVLLAAIEKGGTTIRSYTSSLGVTGRFQLEIQVHSRENEPCNVCGTKIKKIQHATRGTYFCPCCQKRK